MAGTKIGADDAGNRADIHNAGDTEVQVSRFLGHDLTRRAEKERSSLHDGAVDKKRDQIHGSVLLLSLGFRTVDMNAVPDKELAADDKEQDDPGDDVRKGFVQSEHRRDLVGAARHKDE